MDILWISDFHANELVGGAELTSAALIQHAPATDRVTHTKTALSIHHERNHYDIMIVDSMTRLAHPRDMLAKLAAGPFVSIEYDYHKLTRKRHLRHPGDSFLTGLGPWAQYHRMFWRHCNRRLTCFMSALQRDIHLEKLADCDIRLDPSSVWVLSSIFSSEFWDAVKRLRNQAQARHGYAILNSPNPSKGTQQAIAYARHHQLGPIHLFSDLTPPQVLQMLRHRQGLVFTPTREDTCPRLTIEAKLLGCDLHLNDMVQHSCEDWFTHSQATLTDYLMKQPHLFWEKVHALR